MLKGMIHPDFSEVGQVLCKQIPQDKEGGAAVCVYHKGEKVVDVWGGTKNRMGQPWEEDTLSLSFSTTKGVVSTVMHILVDQGKANYDDPISKYWPAFGKNNKERITIRSAMCHQAGLYHIKDMIDDGKQMLNWKYMLEVLENAEPIHKPDVEHGYHALTYGFLVGGLIEAITSKPLSQAVTELLVDPLGLDGMFIGTPDSDLGRVANLVTKNGVYFSQQDSERFEKPAAKILFKTLKLIGADFQQLRTAMIPDTKEIFNWNDREVLQACIPAVNGVFTARSLAKMYAAIANSGEIGGQRILSRERVAEMSKVQNTTRDRVLFLPMRWRLGYHRMFTARAKAANGFGHYGFGGSGACCDPVRNLSIAMTLNSGVGTPMGDTRMAFITGAAIRCSDRRERYGNKHPLILT